MSILANADGTPLRLVDVAKELGISDRKVRYICCSGQLGTKMGKHWVITRADLELFKQENGLINVPPSNTSTS